MAAVRADLAASVPMLRLIQGDVGSGKTAVAAYALALAASSGGQGALLAPTDLLARQLAETVGDLLAETGIPVTLLTGSLSGSGRRAALEAIATGQAQVVVGTHALLQESVSYARLDLVVVDEQHRFGVAQREALAAKGQAPHVLLMTATPIPRTLGQVLYADLDVTDLRTVPGGRERTRTGIRRPSDLAGTWDQVRKEAAAGQRIFVVVPHIDPVGSDEGDDSGELPPAAARGRGRRGGRRRRGGGGAFAGPAGAAASGPGARPHARGRAGCRDVPVPRRRAGRAGGHHGGRGRGRRPRGNDDDRAQRGPLRAVAAAPAARARGARRSAVLLRAGRRRARPTASPPRAWRAIRATTDGFELAEQDWPLRREGDVLGLAQSGLPRLRLASLARKSDQELAVHCRALAESMVDAAGRLSPDFAAFADELEHGWLAAVASGEGAAEEAVGA